MTLAETIFLFNPKKNQPVIDGTHSLAQVEGSPIARLFRAFLMMEVVAVVPISLLMAAAFSLILRVDFLSNFLVGFVMCTLAALYIVVMGYRMRRKLFTQGKMVDGIVTSYESRLTFSWRGYREGVRVHYAVQLPDGTSTNAFTLISTSKTQLPDGRALPAVGTRIAVLWINKLTQTVL